MESLGPSAHDRYKANNEARLYASLPTVHLEGAGEPGMIRVVGTTYYQKAAERVAKRNREEDLRIQFTATLIPEYDNPLDLNAIAVYGEGREIGHLSREDAARYRDVLRRLAPTATITVPATIYAGHHGGSSWDIGLRLPPPEQL